MWPRSETNNGLLLINRLNKAVPVSNIGSPNTIIEAIHHRGDFAGKQHHKGCDDKPEHHRTRVAHEYLGGMSIERQKSANSAYQGKTNYNPDHIALFTEAVSGAMNRKQQHPYGDYCGNPPAQAVESV